MRLKNASIFTLLVQFEDIDVNGVVHHPQYLKYLERARSKGLKDCGYRVDELLKMDIALAIAEIHSHYLRPARVDQTLYIISCVLSVGKAMVKLRQVITTTIPLQDALQMVGDDIHTLANTIFWADLSLVCVDLETARPRSLPLSLKQSLMSSQSSPVLNSKMHIIPSIT